MCPWMNHPGKGRVQLAGGAKLGLTCRTMGSCSGGLLFSTPIVSHTWNAVSCSAKNGLCCGAGRGALVRAGLLHPTGLHRPTHHFSHHSARPPPSEEVTRDGHTWGC